MLRIVLLALCLRPELSIRIKAEIVLETVTVGGGAGGGAVEFCVEGKLDHFWKFRNFKEYRIVI